MRQVPRHRVVESACSRVGRAAQTAAIFLGILCLFYIIVFIAFVPASFEERIGYLFLFGLIPALGCYLIGHILRGALALSCKLCSMIAPHCLRWQARFTNSVLNWANGSARDLLERCSLTLAHCRLATGNGDRSCTVWIKHSAARLTASIGMSVEPSLIFCIC
jgi:hypothetical protein